jgi:NitT/TauT family transport system substrate-binding protein
MTRAPRTGGLRSLRMILNTFYSGPQAWFFLADDRGYLRDEGIELEFTEGDTAANAVPKVASSTYDVGYGDMNALIEMAAAGAPAGAVGVFATFNDSPYTIAVPAGSAIRRPADLTGKTLGAHPNDAAMRMLPEFAVRTGIDASRVAIDISPLPHRDMVGLMLNDGKWDGLFGFVNTLRSAAIEAGVDPAGRLRFLEYRTYVPELYGSALMVNRALLDSEPAVVAGLVRAVNRGLMDTVADVDAAIDAVARRNPHIDRLANRERLAGTLALEMGNPEGARLGIGDIDPERLRRAIDLIVSAKELPRRPDPTEVFQNRFLPPLAERVRTLARNENP